MKTVENGVFVKLCYTGKLAQGEEFEPDRKCQPIEFQVGAGEVIKGFEEAVVGMREKEKRIFTLDPDDAYGERDERLQRAFEKDDLPPDFSAGVGEMIAIETDKGDQFLATVRDVNEEAVILDLNHPLAGKSLTFEVEVQEINA